jgi:hypothetical protein
VEEQWPGVSSVLFPSPLRKKWTVVLFIARGNKPFMSTQSAFLEQKLWGETSKIRLIK